MSRLGPDEEAELDDPVNSALPRKLAIILASVAGVAGILIGVFVMVIAAQWRAPEVPLPDSEASRELEALRKDHDSLRASYEQLLAERRCDVIDGLDDCLAAGLKRPERFVESDRELLAARKAAATPHQASHPEPLTQVRTDAAASAEPAPRAITSGVKTQPDVKPAATDPGSLSRGQMVEALRQIPGIALEGGSAPATKEAIPPGKGP